MPELTLICRNATTFTPNGAFDEEAYRQAVQTFVDNRLGIYMASGGSGEGHALTFDELRRVYRAGVAAGRGKIIVGANQPEQNTARASLEHALIAAEAGVDLINIYGPAAWHGYKPTEAEFLAYYDDILPSLKHQVALAPNPIIGYTPRPEAIAAVAKKYGQVAAVNLSGLGDAYLIELQDALGARKLDIYVPLPGSQTMLALGAAGLLGTEANLIPKTIRRYLDESAKGDAAATTTYADIIRFSQLIRPLGAAPRWIKMAMKLFGLPGGDGLPREPYRGPSAEELGRFRTALLALRIPEIDELARKAGLALPG